MASNAEMFPIDDVIMWLKIFADEWTTAMHVFSFNKCYSLYFPLYVGKYVTDEFTTRRVSKIELWCFSLLIDWKCFWTKCRFARNLRRQDTHVKSFLWGRRQSVHVKTLLIIIYYKYAYNFRFNTTVLRYFDKYPAAARNTTWVMWDKLAYGCHHYGVRCFQAVT